ncbi:MAG: hypothetical protein ACTS41_00505 [Candidatus Hodgkinia cicadicola]
MNLKVFRLLDSSEVLQRSLCVITFESRIYRNVNSNGLQLSTIFCHWFELFH